MISKKFVIHGIISIVFFIGSIAALVKFSTIIYTQREIGFFIVLVMTVIAFYVGLVNIKDIEISSFSKKFTVNSLIKAAGLFLLIMSLFISIIFILVWYSNEDGALTLSYFLETVDFSIVICYPTAYISYMMGLKLYFVKTHANDTD